MYNNFSLFLLFYLICYTFQGTKNKIEDLFDGLYKGDIYSGYLTTKIPDNELFYVYFPSQNSPSTSPLMLWLNGGPGCSSLYGMLSEIGPVVFTDFTNKKFFTNEYSWNKNANLLFIEQPAGVGFSKTKNPDFLWTDDVTAENLLYGLKDFFNLFEDLKGRNFYVSGESYAGVYIPYLSEYILEDQSTDKINLKGVLIGNPLTYFDTDSERSMVEFGFWHGLISIETYESFQKNCPHLNDELKPEEKSDNYFQLNDILIPRNVTHKCNELRNIIRDNFQGNDIYGIYRKCPKESRLELIGPKYDSKIHSMKYFILDKLNPYKNEIFRNHNLKSLEPESIIWPNSCGEDLTIDDFLNNQTVKNKLKVYNSSMTWYQCNDLNYDMIESFNFYAETMLKYPNLTVWVFSGTDDGVLSTLGTMRWINKLNFTVETKWRQWKVNDQVAGFVQKYKEGLTIVTVKGAGHMVPQDQHASAFHMVNSFFKDELP